VLGVDFELVDLSTAQFMFVPPNVPVVVAISGLVCLIDFET